MNQEIRLLLDQWTEAASFEFENGNPQYAQALEQCVIDLEKLTSPAGQEAPPLTDDEDARVDRSAQIERQGLPRKPPPDGSQR